MQRAMRTDLAESGQVTGRRGGRTHLDAIPLQIVQLVAKLFRCEIDLSENFTHQRAGQILAWVIWHRRRSAIRMAVEHMAAFLSDSSKSQSQKDFFHSLAVNDGQSAHPATSICCKPTNRGSSSPLTRYSSRHNSRTSFKFFWSSSSVLPWLCAPEIPGTKPTYSCVSGSHSRYAANVLIDNTSTMKPCLAGHRATIAESRAFVEIHNAANMERHSRERRMVDEATVPNRAEC